MIEANGLQKAYGAKVAVAGVSLAVRAGEIVGLVGPNGAGKSTILKILTGLVQPDGGSASIAGYDIGQRPIDAKRQLGYVPESPQLFEQLSGDVFLDIVSSLYHLPLPLAARRREALWECFELLDERHNPISTYSKGMRQKVVIAAALIHEPSVLILDEPFDALDPNAISLMKRLIRTAAAEGKAIIFSSHIIDLVERLATRVCVIHNGRKVGDGTAAAIGSEVGSSSLEDAFNRLTTSVLHGSSSS